MIDQIYEGSLTLRKTAGRVRAAARLISGGLHLGKKGVSRIARFAYRNPIIFPIGVLGLGAIPGAYRRWKTDVEIASPLNPANTYRTDFWERPQ